MTKFELEQLVGEPVNLSRLAEEIGISRGYLHECLREGKSEKVAYRLHRRFGLPMEKFLRGGARF